MIIKCKSQRKGDVKKIKIESGREKEKEVIVRQENISSKWKRWTLDNFSHDWNKNYSV